MKNKGALFGILAAILFGASTPGAKLLMGEIHPWLLAGLLYLGSALGLALFFLLQRFTKWQISNEASLTKADWPWLFLAVLNGGILGPLFLMFGLSTISGSTASLLLNLETVFTVLIAWFVFKEFVNTKLVAGVLLVLSGSFLLSWTNNFSIENYHGIIFVCLACLFWGLDNNFTKKISARDPLQIALIKCLVAGLTNTILASFWMQDFPSSHIIFIACIVGFFGYGLSIYFFILGLRYVGAARTGAYFSLAPFIGAIISIIFLHDHFTIQFLIASILMGIGIWLL